MTTKKYRVSLPENYQDKDDNTKTFWHDIGTLTTFLTDGKVTGRLLEIPAYNMKAQVFEIEEKKN